MLETRLVAIIKGRQFFEVLRDLRPLFTGSLSECKRFATLHLEKELKAQRNKRRRDKPQARIYRVWARPMAASAS